MSENWGIRPVLFKFGHLSVESYPIMLSIAITIGLLIYLLQMKRDGVKNSNALYLVIFALVGGTIGSKIPIILLYWDEFNQKPYPIEALLSGKTILGGLIGGMVSVFLAKKLFKIKDRMGNYIAIPVVISMAIGRVGCFLRGCCYGKPTHLPWGVDFGDHIMRHPTQLYEMLFDICLAIYLIIRKKKGVKPGTLFRIFLNCYMSFRFFIEFIRVEKVFWMGLTDFQLLCVVSLIYINRREIINFFRREKVVKNGATKE